MPSHFQKEILGKKTDDLKTSKQFESEGEINFHAARELQSTLTQPPAPATIHELQLWDGLYMQYIQRIRVDVSVHMYTTVCMH